MKTFFAVIASVAVILAYVAAAAASFALPIMGCLWLFKHL